MLIHDLFPLAPAQASVSTVSPAGLGPSSADFVSVHGVDFGPTSGHRLDVASECSNRASHAPSYPADDTPGLSRAGFRAWTHVPPPRGCDLHGGRVGIGFGRLDWSESRTGGGADDSSDGSGSGDIELGSGETRSGAAG